MKIIILIFGLVFFNTIVGAKTSPNEVPSIDEETGLLVEDCKNQSKCSVSAGEEKSLAGIDKMTPEEQKQLLKTIEDYKKRREEEVNILKELDDEDK